MKFRMSWAVCCVCVAAVCQAVQADEPLVKLTPGDHSVKVTINDVDFTTYHTDPKWQKPFFSPVHTPSGGILTRGLESPESKDHPHHKGVWLAIDEVNGAKHWAEKSRIKNVGVELLVPSGDPAVMKVTNEWLGDDGQPTITETTKISIYSNRLMAYDIHFTAGDKEVTWGDTKEGLFGIRLADSVREKQPKPETSAGKVVNAEGLQATAQCWGKVSAWVDYSGPVGDQIEGVALFDNPQNFRASRYHVRDYGLFTISPFGQHSYTNGELPAEEFRQKAGSTFRLQYALYVHSGDAQAGKVADTYARYVEQSKD